MRRCASTFPRLRRRAPRRRSSIRSIRRATALSLFLRPTPTPLIYSFYSPGNTPISFSQHTTTDIIDIVWTARNAPVGATFDLDWALDGGAHTVITGVSSPYSHQKTGTGGHGLDL